MMSFLPIILSFVLMIGCTSKVDQVLDLQTKEERSLKASEEEKERNSGVLILDNSSISNPSICGSTNQLKILVTENSSQPIKCLDQTKLSEKLTVGPICPGGVEIKDFSNSKSTEACSKISICGVKPSKTIALNSGSDDIKITQLIYERLPWGCVGKINVRGEQSLEVPIEIKPPPCEFCSGKGISTCEACGEDTVPPVFTEIFVDKSNCRSFNIIVFADDAQSGLHRQPYSYNAGLTWTDENRYLVEARTLSFAADTIWVRDRAGNITKYATALNETAGLCGCTTPWGETIGHGVSRTAYQNNELRCDQSCSSQSEVRTCEDGVLSGTATFKYGSCISKECPSCTAPWGEVVKHNQTIKAYKQSEVVCKEQCESKTVRCENGRWLEDFSSFVIKTCSYTQPKCDCDHIGRIIKNGESLKVYNKNTYQCNESAVEGSVQCQMGTLSGNTDYSHVSYTIKPCKCVTPWGQMLDRDEVTTAYKASVTTCTDSFTCDSPTNKIRIKCDDNLNNTQSFTGGPGPITDYASPSCSFKPCKCRHLNMEFGPNDPPLKVYKNNVVRFPNRCDLNGNMGQVTCSPSILLTGDTSSATFPYTECSDGSGKATGTGNSDYEVGLGAGGGSGGGIGNDSGDGEGFRRRSKGGGGSGCNPDNAPYYCLIYGPRLVSTISYQFCLLPGVNGYSMQNTESIHFKQRIETGGWISAYSRKEVTKPDSCSNYMGIIRCSDSKMSDSSTYKYLDCTEID